MKFQKWMKSFGIILILSLSMLISAAGQSDSTDCQDFSKQQLMTLELQQVAKILPQAESYYHQNKLKDESLEKKDEVIDKLNIALAKTDLREIEYLDQLKIKDGVIEEVKPKWWQHPIVIAGEVLLALFVGIQIGG